MKISGNREQMLAGFQTAAMVAPSRSPKPILQCVKLEASQQSLVFLATDMEISVRIEVEGVTVHTPGQAILPVARFGSILRDSTDSELEIETTEQGTRVKGSRSVFQLTTENPDEFPQIASFSADKYHELPARLFKELIRRTLFATDTESSRYALGGVLLEFGEATITAVGTDGRRLAKMEGPAVSQNGHRSGETTTIVPSRSMQLIERALVDPDVQVKVAARDNDVLVESPRVTVFSRLVEGRFPKWRDVFPVRQNAVQVEIPVGPFYSAVRQASVVASDESRGLDFTFAEGSVTLSGSTANIGQSRVEFPIHYEGPPIVLTLDHRFMLEFLRVLNAESSFKMEITNGESAAVCSTDDGYGYVVMPLARDR